jgi:hypothetical protein
MLAHQGVDIVLFSSPDQGLIASATRDPFISVPQFEAAASLAIRKTAQGDEAVDTIRVGEQLYDVVSIPVRDPQDYVVRALTLGSKIDSPVAQRLGRLAHCEIVLLAQDQTIVSPFSTPESKRDCLALFNQLSRDFAGVNNPLRVQKAVLGGEHYYCSGGWFNS